MSATVPPWSSCVNLPNSRIVRNRVHPCCYNENRSNGFRETGIWPIDRNVFDEHNFAVAQPTGLASNTDAPPRDRDTDAPPRDRDRDAPPRDRDTGAPPRDRDTDAPPPDQHTDKRRILQYRLFRRYPKSTRLQCRRQRIQDRTRGQRETGNLPTTKLKQFKEEKAPEG